MKTIPASFATLQLLAMYRAQYDGAVQSVLAAEAKEKGLPEGAQLDTGRGVWILPENPEPSEP